MLRKFLIIRNIFDHLEKSLCKECRDSFTTLKNKLVLINQKLYIRKFLLYFIQNCFLILIVNVLKEKILKTKENSNYAN